MDKILIIDDDIESREAVSLILTRAGYSVKAIRSTVDIISEIRRFMADLVIMDVVMHGIDGIALCRQIKANPGTASLPVLFITQVSDRRTRVDAFEAGGNDFISKPFDQIELLLRVGNLLNIRHYTELLENQTALLEAQVEAATSELRKTYDNLREAYVETVEKLTVAAEFRDEETGEHIRRIGYYARVLAEEMGLDKEFCENIFYAAPMHDIGKIAIPDHILLKPGRLTDAEFYRIQSHTIIGWKLLRGSKSAMLELGANIALNHHEKYDGSGYPHGLKGDKIPIEGRIVMTVDIYDALRSKRPYKPAFDHKTVVKIMLEGDERMKPDIFDPDVLAAFRRKQDAFADIFNRFNESGDQG